MAASSESAASEAGVGPSTLTANDTQEQGGSRSGSPQKDVQAEESAPMICFRCRYSNHFHSVRLPSSETVGDLKALLYSLTDVPFERQKILGLTKGKLPSDDTLLGSLTFAPTSYKSKTSDGQDEVTVQLVGTPLSLSFKDMEGANDELENDMIADESSDIDYSAPAFSKPAKGEVPPWKNPRYIAKVDKLFEQFGEFPIMEDPRPGTKLLVLDLDECLVSSKHLLRTTATAMESARPGLHDFLAAVYPFYTLAVWSATSWRFIEAKLTELHMLSDPRYKISFILSKVEMPHVTTNGKKHRCKPLRFIWKRFHQFNETNTLHLDDLNRNFAMNPFQGMPIKAYKSITGMDTELMAATRYLKQMAHESVTDVSKYDHKKWKFFQGPERQA